MFRLLRSYLCRTAATLLSHNFLQHHPTPQLSRTLLFNSHSLLHMNYDEWSIYPRHHGSWVVPVIQASMGDWLVGCQSYLPNPQVALQQEGAGFLSPISAFSHKQSCFPRILSLFSSLLALVSHIPQSSRSLSVVAGISQTPRVQLVPSQTSHHPRQLSQKPSQFQGIRLGHKRSPPEITAPPDMASSHEMQAPNGTPPA